jgi:hypothetical protein
MVSFSITAEEADLLADLLKPRTTLLLELLEAQVQHCDEGDAAWASTADALQLASGLMAKVAGARLAGGRHD